LTKGDRALPGNNKRQGVMKTQLDELTLVQYDKLGSPVTQFSDPEECTIMLGSDF
jgi:hypothetical protein